MLALEPVIAPRKEKYLIQTNTMAYFANEQKSRFIEHHRDLLSNADKDIVNPPPLHVNMKEEEKMEQGSIVIPQNDINVVEEVLYYQRERIVDNQEMSVPKDDESFQNADDQQQEEDDDEQMLDIPLI